MCDLKQNKAEVHCTRLMVGGDKVHYPGDVGTPMADLTLVKMHVNSVVSTWGTQYMTLDVKNFYLNMLMVRYEYVHINIGNIPDEINVEYNLKDKVTSDGHVYVEIQKGMYGLPQAGILAQELLENNSTNMATHKAGWFQAYGHIKPVLSHSLLLLMTLE